MSASPEPADDLDLRAADGRVPGRRGRATRAKLLDRTAEMLHSSSYRELKVVDIARGAGTSPATFYQYFPDVESAILVLAEDMAQDGMVLREIVLGSTWKGRQGPIVAAELVDAFMDFWEQHRSLLRVVDLAAIEGDKRFRLVRSMFLRELTNALSDVIAQLKAEGKHPDEVDPMATGAVLVSMLAQVAAHRSGFEYWDIDVDHSRRAMARIVATTVTGQKPPSP